MAKRKLEIASSILEKGSPSTETQAVEKPIKRKKVVASDFQPVDADVLPENAKLDLADAEIYYVPSFVDADTAQRWYNELVELDTCMCRSLTMMRTSDRLAMEVCV